MRLIFRAFFNDAAMYPDPRVFLPERWLDSEGQLLDDAVSPMHPNKVIFGFGRRYDLANSEYDGFWRDDVALFVESVREGI